MPVQHQGMSKEKLISWGYKIHKDIGDFLNKYFAKIPVEEQGYKGAQGIIDLSRKNLPRLITAISEANDYQVYTYSVIKAIYTRLEKQTSFEEMVNNSNLRGPDYYKEHN